MQDKISEKFTFEEKLEVYDHFSAVLEFPYLSTPYRSEFHILKLDEAGEIYVMMQGLAQNDSKLIEFEWERQSFLCLCYIAQRAEVKLFYRTDSGSVEPLDQEIYFDIDAEGKLVIYGYYLVADQLYYITEAGKDLYEREKGSVDRLQVIKQLIAQGVSTYKIIDLTKAQ